MGARTIISRLFVLGLDKGSDLELTGTPTHCHAYCMAKKIFSRRFFIGTGLLALIAAAIPFRFKFLSSKGEAHLSSRTDGFNVLFMTADDVGWKDLSCDGNTNIKTPHLDKLAAEGLRFENAFGVSSSCSPSRASFITGQYISTHGVDGLTHRHLSRQLDRDHPTMARYFKDAGYHTAIQGKWHVATLILPKAYGYIKNIGTILPWKRHIKDTDKISRYFEKRAKKKQPFYLELNFTDTHRNAKGEFKPDPEFNVDPEKIEVPEWMGLPNWPEIRKELALYYGKLLRTDYLVGKTLEELDKAGLSEKTIVVFVSDNGSPFPGNKMTILDRGIGTPLLVKWPNKVKPASVSQAMVSTIDIMPTLLQACEVKFGRQVEGKSFLTLLQQPDSEHRDYICAEMNYHVDPIPMRAIRTKGWKAIQNLSDSPIGLDDLEDQEWAQRLCQREDQPWLRPRPDFELYDLVNDPYEKNNLAGLQEYAEIEADFKRRLNDNWPQSKA